MKVAISVKNPVGTDSKTAFLQGSPSFTYDPRWGRIANALRKGQEIVTALFFAGPPNPNSLPLYTRHPKDRELSGWSDASIDFALQQMNAVGLNTIKLSYWGYEGEADAWAPAWLFSQQRWPGDSGTNPYTQAEQIAQGKHFFAKAAEHGLMVGPLIEVSPKLPLDEQLPDRLNELISRASWLLLHFGDQANFLQMYDSTGEPRRVLWLINSVARGKTVDPEVFATAFDTAAKTVEERTGYKVGFILSPISLYPYANVSGPQPSTLAKHPSILAINPYMPELEGLKNTGCESCTPVADRLTRAENVMKLWSSSDLPFIAPVTPGYDARKVFSSLGAYGFTDSWRKRQIQMALDYATGGIAIDTWNGWAEGYGIPPSVEGSDANMKWASDLVSALNRSGKAHNALPGDVNGDGGITVKDALLLLQFSIGQETPTSFQILAGDVQPNRGDQIGDGKLGLADAIWTLRHAVGLTLSF